VSDRLIARAASIPWRAFMPLSKPALKSALQDVFTRAKDEGWSVDRVAAGLADAIDAYVRAGAVRGVRVDPATFDQNRDGRLE
jgi:hypothetical protein